MSDRTDQPDKPPAHDKLSTPSGSDQLEQRRQWLEQNQTAVQGYNQRVQEHGVFSDGLRAF